MPKMELNPSHYLKSYGWKSIEQDPDNMGVIYTHSRYPGHEIVLKDDNSMEHQIKGNIIARVPSKRIQGYLAGYHKY